jgi:RNA polymerase sigma factor (TIGR02999 family)
VQSTPTLSSLIAAAEQGDGSAAESLFAALYVELHRLAKRELARRGARVNISVTTLLHDAYLDMAERGGASFPDRARFLGYAARVMRGLIVDYARKQHAHKRGGQFHITAIDTHVADGAADPGRLTAISDALDELATIEPALAEVVDLKFFCGFSFAEIAEMRGISERTVQRNWDKARLYLHRSIRGDAAI